MPCYYPLDGWLSKERNPTGKRSIVFQKSEALVDKPVKLPCGQCIGCRLEKSRQWAVRMMHEAQMHKSNSFITLTYNDDHLPESGSLDKKHFQDFMKRLRKHYPQKIRYFHCGEYGDKGLRAHYHAILFNIDFEDKKIWKINEETKDKYYTSEKLEKIWGKGFCVITDVTFESAGYVARYCTKKITGEKAFDHYNEYCPYTGEIFTEWQPEYATMSRRPGIGKTWFDKYGTDVYPDDEVIVRGLKTRPPKFYDGQLEKFDKQLHQSIKNKRVADANKGIDDNNLKRLRVKEAVKKASLSFLKER